MSGLNVSIGFLLGVVTLGLSAGSVLKLRPLLSFSAEFPASFILVACWLEVQTLMEVGPWAGGLGPDVAATTLFFVLLVQGAMFRDASGNPLVVLMKFLLCESTPLCMISALIAHFAGAWLAQLLTRYYWSLELSDMHMIKNLMARDCSPTLRVSVPQGAFTEGVCALVFHLILLNLQRSSAVLRVPLVALVLTFLSYAASSHTSGFINPSLAYALTFHCLGFTFTEYAMVFWLAPFIAMVLALFLYTGHIPRLFTRNLLYSQKACFWVPKTKHLQEHINRKAKKKAEKKGT
ncbi:aquaporin-12-like [Arapaima gigas]